MKMTVLLLASLAGNAADRFVPAPYQGQQIEGILGERMRVNLEGRPLRVDEKGILDCFRHRPGPQAWAGEQPARPLPGPRFRRDARFEERGEARNPAPLSDRLHVCAG